MANSLIWVLLFILATIGMLIFVPRKEIVRLLPFGVVGGFLLAVAIQWAAVLWLRVWRFSFTQFASYRGIPVFLTLAWMPLVILFGYWLLGLRSGTSRFFYIAAFALASAAIEWAFVLTGFRSYLRFWNIGYTAVLALVLHYLLAAYLLATRPEERLTTATVIRED